MYLEYNIRRAMGIYRETGGGAGFSRLLFQLFNPLWQAIYAETAD
jgi:hypothetical protein